MERIEPIDTHPVVDQTSETIPSVRQVEAASKQQMSANGGYITPMPLGQSVQVPAGFF